LVFNAGSDPLPLAIAIALVGSVPRWLALFRSGLLTFLVCIVGYSLLMNVPWTVDPTAWWAAPTWITLASPPFLAPWGLRVAVAGQPVFRERLFEG